jgi:hypothetical protein
MQKQRDLRDIGTNDRFYRLGAAGFFGAGSLGEPVNQIFLNLYQSHRGVKEQLSDIVAAGLRCHHER